MSKELDTESKTQARLKEIVKAIKLIGWMSVSDRLKTEGDRKIFNELQEKQNASFRRDDDRMLKKAGITL